MRSYTGVFSDYAYINEDLLAQRSGLTRQQVYECLISLTRQNILHYIPGKKTPYIIYTRERQETDRLHFSKEVYEDRKASYERRIKAMLEYADSDHVCRSRMLLRYFGEKNRHNCGQCDVCLQKHESGLKQGEFEEIREILINRLKESPRNPHDLINGLDFEQSKTEKVLAFLLSEEEIVQKNGSLYLKS